MTRALIHVLHVNRVGFLGGTERVLLILASNEERHGYSVTVACPDEGELGDLLRDRGINFAPLMLPHIRRTLNPLKLGIYIRGLISVRHSIEKIIIKSQINVIHVHHPVSALLVLKASRKHNIPIVLHVHDALPMSILYRLLFKLVCPRVQSVVCVSGAGLKMVQALVPNLSSPVRVIHNSVDDKLIHQKQDPSGEVVGQGPHIGIFAVLEPRKGQDILLQAAPKVLSVFPEAKFWIVGAATGKYSSRYEKDLRETASRAPLADHIIFTGYRRDPHALMSAMDVVVSSSVREESLSMSIIESLVLGCRTVATNVGGAREIIEDGITGWLVEPGDPAALSDCLVSVLNQTNRDMMVSISEESRKRFAPGTFRDRFREIYKSVCQGDISVHSVSARSNERNRNWHESIQSFMRK